MGHFFIGNWMYVPTFRFPERLALVRACAHALRACAHMMRACAQPCARMRAAMHACMHAVLKKFGPSLLSWSSWSSSSSWPSLLSWPPCRGQEHYLAVACRSPKWAASTNGWTNNLEACQSMDMFRTKSEKFPGQSQKMLGGIQKQSDSLFRKFANNLSSYQLLRPNCDIPRFVLDISLEISPNPAL